MAWFHPIIVSGGCLSTFHSSPVLMLSGTQVASLWRGCFLLVFSSVLVQHSPPPPMGQALPAPSPTPTAVMLHGCKSPWPRTPLHFSHLNPYDVHDCTPLQPGITLACNVACTGDPSPGLPVCSPHPLLLLYCTFSKHKSVVFFSFSDPLCSYLTPCNIVSAVDLSC